MGKFTYRDGVAVGQIGVFAPALVCAFFLCLRHGFSRTSGWLLLISFTCVRLVGASCQLVTITNPSRDVITTELICLYIGLSPLTLICWGVLSRINEQVYHRIPNILYRGLSLVSLAGLALGIYGATKQTSKNSDPFKWNIFSKSAVVIFVAVFLCVVLGFCVLLAQISSVPRADRRIFAAVFVSIPLIAVRLAYALLSEFANDHRFNSYFGNVTYYLCMAVIEECIVVVVFTITGFTLPRLPRGDNESGRLNGSGSRSSSDPSLKEARDYGYRNQYMYTTGNPGLEEPLQKARRAKSPTTWLFYKGQDLYRARRN